MEKQVLWEAHVNQLSGHNSDGQSNISPTDSAARCREQLTSVTAFPHSLQSCIHSASRVYNSWLLHDQTILLQTGDVAARVGEGYFINLVGVQPDFALATFEDWCGEALLEFERHCGKFMEEKGLWGFPCAKWSNVSWMDPHKMDGWATSKRQQSAHQDIEQLGRVCAKSLKLQETTMSSTTAWRRQHRRPSDSRKRHRAWAPISIVNYLAIVDIQTSSTCRRADVNSPMVPSVYRIEISAGLISVRQNLNITVVRYDSYVRFLRMMSSVIR